MNKEHVLLSKLIMKSELIASKHKLSEASADAMTALVTLAFAAGYRLANPEEEKKASLTLVENVIDIRSKR